MPLSQEPTILPMPGNRNPKAIEPMGPSFPKTLPIGFSTACKGLAIIFATPLIALPTFFTIFLKGLNILLNIPIIILLVHLRNYP